MKPKSKSAAKLGQARQTEVQAVIWHAMLRR
jgi:hypothetical protein